MKRTIIGYLVIGYNGPRSAHLTSHQAKKSLRYSDQHIQPLTESSLADLMRQHSYETTLGQQLRSIADQLSL